MKQGNSQDKFEQARKLYSVPQSSPELFPEPEADNEPSSYGEYVTNQDLSKLIERGKKALKWSEAEFAIAKNVFKPGDPRRKQKLGERAAVARWVREVVNFLETGELPSIQAPIPEPSQPGRDEKSYGYPPARNEGRVIR
jgi:hypothetical protein